MVQVTDYKMSTSNDGKDFILLKVEGDLEPVQSAKTGRAYFKAKSAYVASTLSEHNAQRMIGKELPGDIVRVISDPYDITTDDGEVITLRHRYEYVMEGSLQPATPQTANQQIEETVDF
jgi:hypothetical protein